MIVTIDGPAGAGKSTVARRLAQRLGFRFLDTGAMYRAAALAAYRAGLNGDPQAVAELVQTLHIELTDKAVLLNGEDVSSAIRTSEITAVTKWTADNPAVRSKMVEWQQAIGRGVDLVTEGRDQGTVVFPNAECKIFLTASPDERARRRCFDLQSAGESVEFDQVLADQQARDQRDASREVGPLIAAADAVEVLTDGLTQDQVVDRLEALVMSRRT